MKKKLAVLFVLFCVAAIGVLFWPQSTPTYQEANFANSVSIAPPSEALTFARARVDGEAQLLAALEYRDNQVTVLDLDGLFDQRFDDPVDLFNAVGYESIQQRIESEPSESRRQVDAMTLIQPLALTDSHIAAGTNFAAHADESSVEDGPFLFAKLVTPTPFHASVTADGALLDYEVELAFVTLSETPLESVPQHMGLILTNDFTDRAKLLRHLNPDDIVSGDGFTTGKSAPGFLPVGNLFVIPRDLKSFANSIELNLSVNDKLRQSASMELAIWDIDELFRQIQSRQETRWMHLGNQIGLPVQDGKLPGRTLILSGTPAGTVFSGISTRTMARGALRWVAGGWGKSIKQQVIEQYINAANGQGHYLQPGDEVTIQVNKLGRIQTDIR
jgi:2,4-diketo-3-deoxy-L-fuconate hydrolase